MQSRCNDDIISSNGAKIEPWITARSRFLDGLSDSTQRQLFENATLENMFFTASAGFQQHESSKLSAIARKRVKPLLESLDGFSKALDVLSQSSASVLCPLWGGIRIVLHLALEYDKYFTKLMIMYERIGDALPRFRAYEALFPTHDTLLASLADAYLEVVNFSYDACRVFTLPQAKLRKPLSPLKHKWKPFEAEFDQYMDRFRRHQKNVTEQAHLAHMIEGRKTHDLILADRALQKKNAEIDEYRQVRDMLSTYDYMAKHRIVRSMRHDGTGQWILQHTEVRKWLGEPSSNLFVCFGIPGSGKTILASAVIDDVDNSQSRAKCFHYIDYAEDVTLDARNIIGNITRQFLDRKICFPKAIERCRQFLNTGFPIALDVAVHCLEELLEDEGNALIVIDGIDELALQSQHLLMEIIRRICRSPKFVVKVLFFCRRNERFVRMWLAQVPSLTISIHDNGQDLSRFIEHRVHECVAGRQLVLHDYSLEQEIVNKLVTGADHM
jgi:nucleoside-triphosphatase THEP1